MVQKEQIGTLSVHESAHSDFMAIQRHRACMRIVQNLVDLFKFRDGSTGGGVWGGVANFHIKGQENRKYNTFYYCYKAQSYYL